MMRTTAAFGWSLLTVYLGGAAVALDLAWFFDVGLVIRATAVFIWVLLLVALMVGTRRGRGWGLSYGVSLLTATVLVYAIGGLVTLEPLWFHDVAAWLRLTAVSGVAMAAIGIAEGSDFFG